MTVIIKDRGEIILDAEINVSERKAVRLAADVETAEETLKGLAVLSGCVEAILINERERRQKA